MNPIIYTLLAIPLAIVTFGGVILWARTYATDLRSASSFLDDYYRCAQRVIRDEETPASILHFVDWFARKAGDPALARKLAIDAALGRLAEKPDEKFQAFERDMRRLRPETAQAFAEMLTKGLAASAAADPVFSRAYLNALWLISTQSGRAGDASSIERANSVALDITRGHREDALCAA